MNVNHLPLAIRALQHERLCADDVLFGIFIESR